jgi:hypothetical protein
MAEGSSEVSVNRKSDKAKDLTEGIRRVNILRDIGTHPVSLANSSEKSSLIRKHGSQPDDTDQTNEERATVFQAATLEAETFVLTLLLV